MTFATTSDARVALETRWSETVKAKQRDLYVRWTPAEIERSDTELFHRFEAQYGDFWHALHGGTDQDLECQGQAMLRGFTAVEAKMLQTSQPLDFSRARPQKGFAPHPGPAPSRTSGMFRAWYAAYLLTAEWSSKCEAVERRCDNLCEGCAGQPVSQIHHLTYEHVGREFLYELVGLCRGCHQRVHGRLA